MTKGPEQKYCRTPMAAMFNAMPGSRWATNTNTFARKGGRKASRVVNSPERGRPDAFVNWSGAFFDLECKADFGSLYLGNPDNAQETIGFHASQRWWYFNKALPTGTPYWLAVWIHKERNPRRVTHRNAVMYLVPAEMWLSLEAAAKAIGTRTVPLFAREGKLSVAEWWRGHELEYVNSEAGYRIPARHPVRKLIKP
jgi:hypothetical protein